MKIKAERINMQKTKKIGSSNIVVNKSHVESTFIMIGCIIMAGILICVVTIFQK